MLNYFPLTTTCTNTAHVCTVFKTFCHPASQHVQAQSLETLVILAQHGIAVSRLLEEHPAMHQPMWWDADCLCLDTFCLMASSHRRKSSSSGTMTENQSINTNIISSTHSSRGAITLYAYIQTVLHWQYCSLTFALLQRTSTETGIERE